MVISERGDSRVIVSIVLDRWSNRSSWLVELGEQYRVQMNFQVLGREIFIQMS